MSGREDAERYLRQLRGVLGTQGLPPAMAREVVEKALRDIVPPEQLDLPETRAMAERMIELAITGGVDAVMASVLERRQAHIEEAAASSTDMLDIEQHPVVAHLRTGQLNAVTMLVPNSDGYLVLLEDQLPLFVTQLSKIVAWAVPREETDGQGDSVFRMSIPDVTRRIADEPSVAAWFADVVVTYATTGRLAVRERSLPRDYTILAGQLEAATIYFVLGHEYAHIMYGHLHEAGSTAAVLPVEEETLDFSWNQELDADLLGLILGMNATMAHEGLAYERAFVGAGLFFDALDAIDRAVAILETGDEEARQVGSHPPSSLRKERVRETITQVRDADPRRWGTNVQRALWLDDIQSETIRLLWDRTRPRLIDLHEKGVRAARAWRSISKEAPTPGHATFETYTPDDDSLARDRSVIETGHPQAAPPAMIRLASALADRGDAKEAERLYRRALASGHRSAAPQAAVNLGRILLDRGERTAARELFEQGYASRNGEAAPGAMFYLALMAEGDGDNAAARRFYREAVDSDHPSVAPGASLNLAMILRADGDEDAEDLFTRAAETPDPDAAPRARFQLAVILLGRGDLDGAVDHLRHGIDSGHDEAAPGCHYVLGLILEQRGERAEARQHHQRARASGHPRFASLADERLQDRG